MERRTCERYFVSNEIEVKAVGSTSLVRCNTSDVSLSGCYVATIFPLAEGTKLEFTMWINGESIKGLGSVRTSHPGVGMGIEFNDLAEEALSRLDHSLQASASTPSEEKARSFFR